MRQVDDRPRPQRRELRLRVVSGLILAAVGFGALVLGGAAFNGLCAVGAGMMMWELSRLVRPDVPQRLAAACGAWTACAVMVAASLDANTAITWLLPGAAALVAAAAVRRGGLLMAAFGAAILYAALILAELRDQHGLAAAAWLVLLVAATDTTAYVCGKSIGGPRLAPGISPGKRWSGAVAGCIAAVLVTAGFAGSLSATVVGFGLALSVASQLGDLAESWIKRRAGVKDSSSVIPGHGGVMDRFDGLAGACGLFGVLELFRVADRVGVA